MRNVLFLMAEIGLGHKMPALAVSESLQCRFPGSFAVQVSDLAAEAGASRSDRMLKESWKAGGEHPWMFRILYFLLNSLHPLGNLYPRLGLGEFMSKGAAWIAARKPDLVAATHPLCGKAALHARRKYGLAFKLAMVVVDPFDAYSWWVEPEADLFIVFSAEARAGLERHGIPAGKIRLKGFPIRPSFMRVSESKQAIRAGLGLDPAMPVLLATAGGFGLGRAGEAVEAIIRRDLAWNVIFVCGRNEALMRRMRELAGEDGAAPGGRTRLKLLGYTDGMNRLLAAADLVLGKAGGSSAMEALCMGVPFIFTDWIAQNDLAIIRYFEKHGYGWSAPNGAAWRLLERAEFKPGPGGAPPAAVGEARRRIAAAGFSSGVDEIARELAGLAGGAE